MKRGRRNNAEVTKLDKRVLVILAVIAIIAAIYLYNPNLFSDLLTPPSAQIKGLTVTDAYEGKLDLTWNPNTEPDLDHYNVYRDGVKIAEAATNSYQDTGLTSGQSYTYQVSAVDTDGNEGQKSEEVSGTPTDSIPPTISNLQPADGATVDEHVPTIGADYSDPSGIDAASVKLMVDGADVTALATVTSTGVTYTPATALVEDQHAVELRVKDTANNEAVETWSFTITIERWALLIGSANDFPPTSTIEKVEENDEVLNWSFESWATDAKPFCWDNQTLTPIIYWWSITDAHTFDYSALMELDPGAEGFWYTDPEYRILVTPNAQYTVTAYTKMPFFDDAHPPIAHVGILWYDSTGSPIGTTIWSSGVSGAAAWTPVTLTTTSPSHAASAEIRLKGKNPSSSDMCWVLFDTVSMWHYKYENNSSTLSDKDGFPAQVLQAYYTLKAHGYDDDHIILMLYHKNDAFIDIEGDGVNDLTNAVIDVEDDAVTKDRLGTEMQNLTAMTGANDEVLIYLVGHGSRVGTTAYYHFETGDNVSEQEMDLWLDNITCGRMTVLVDTCYSGNFITSLSANNRILVSASADLLAKWWVEADPPDQPYAGSWFFHPFWERIDAEDSIQAAYNYACGTVPIQVSQLAGMTVQQIQDPQLIDCVGDVDTYSFVG